MLMRMQILTQMQMQMQVLCRHKHGICFPHWNIQVERADACANAGVNEHVEVVAFWGRCGCTPR